MELASTATVQRRLTARRVPVVAPKQQQQQQQQQAEVEVEDHLTEEEATPLSPQSAASAASPPALWELKLSELQQQQQQTEKTTEEEEEEDGCVFQVVARLAGLDRQLSSRLGHKVAAAQASTSAREFVTKMQQAREVGTFYSCGFTQAWVAEVLEGLESQYEEYKNGASAFHTLLGAEVLRFFQARANSPQRVIYHVRHAGSEDHVLTVEQLPRGRGYRIYQSAFQSYSLKAWLAPSLEGLYSADSGELMLLNGDKAKVSAMLDELSGGAASLQSLGSLPPSLKIAQPYVAYIRDYDEGEVVKNFTPAWAAFGRGRVLTPGEFFDDYLHTTALLTEYFHTHCHSDTPFSVAAWDAWMALYGSPNRMHFPGLPFHTPNDLIMHGATYRFQVRDVALPENSGRPCLRNASILEAALASQF